MTLLNLNLVTKTILNLLTERLPLYPDWPSGATLTASSAPPDALNGSHALSFYLFHLKEDAHTKSQDWQTLEAVPLRYKPMGLTLNYVLCPRSNASSAGDRSNIDQLLMGLAVKTLHDFPVIDDTTVVDVAGTPTLVMPAALRGRGNRFRIQMLPTPMEEATHYWQSSSLPTRLAAFYEVSAVLLDPEEPRSRSARVLSVGVHPFVRGCPSIEGTRSTVSFTLPGEAAPRELLSSPAQVTPGGSFEVYGSDLKGDETRLLLHHQDFPEPLEVDAPWNLVTNGSVLSATARSMIGSQAILPGVYGVFVQTTTRRNLPDGSTRDFDFLSNQMPLLIAPGLAGLSFAAGLGTLQVSGFDPSPLTGTELMFFAGSERLTRATAAPGPGQFRTVAPDKLEFRLPAGTVPGSYLALRLVVRSAESEPFWLVAP
jgi:hypothetical protein